MEACLKTGVSYLDTASYESPDNPHLYYIEQWSYFDKFKEAGITGILGCGFDPGSPVCSQLMQPNIISTKYITWI